MTTCFLMRFGGTWVGRGAAVSDGGAARPGLPQRRIKDPRAKLANYKVCVAKVACLCRPPRGCVGRRHLCRPWGFCVGRRGGFLLADARLPVGWLRLADSQPCWLTRSSPVDFRLPKSCLCTTVVPSMFQCIISNIIISKAPWHI